MNIDTEILNKILSPKFNTNFKKYALGSGGVYT